MPIIDGAPIEMAQEHNIEDQLVTKIGTAIITNERYIKNDWQKTAIVAEIENGSEGTFGYVFFANGDWEARTPKGFDILDTFLELQSAMERRTGKKWHRALVHMTRETGVMNITFEYDDPTRWTINPAKLEESVEALRP